MTTGLGATDAPFEGRWWDPADRDSIVGGRLDLDDRDIWRLKLFGWLGKWSEDENDDPPHVIHGQVDGVDVTVMDVVPGSWIKGELGAPHTSEMSATTVIAGLHATGDMRYTSARVRLLNLNEWANRRPWSFDHSSDPDSSTMTYRRPENKQAKLPGASIELWRDWGRSGGGLSGVTLTSNEWVFFEFETPTDLEAIEHDWVRPLVSLIGLATGEASPCLELKVTPDGEDLVREVAVLSAAPRRSLPEPGVRFRFLFTLDDIDFSATIPAWWTLHSELSVVADLVDALRVGRGYVSEQFLMAASAIEGYHRHLVGSPRSTREHKDRIMRITEAVVDEDDRAWLKDRLAFSHEPTFASRVDDVVARAGLLFPPAVGNLEKWRKWVKAGRNAVAHRDPSMLHLDAEWRTTVRVTASIRWLLTLALLRDLGIQDRVINERVTRGRGLQWMTEGLREACPDWFD